MSRGRDRSIAVLERPVSFVRADQRLLLCPGCERLFRTTNTEQTCCSFACATEARHDHAAD